LPTDIRELAGGGYRAAVLDVANVEVWCDVCDDHEESPSAAEAWIQEQDAPAR
jgi:hypothetical protein